MLMILSFLGATAPAPEQGPDPPQELVPEPALAPAASLEPELAHPIAAAVAYLSGEAVTALALLGPVQVVDRALIHSPEMEEPSTPLPDLEVQQGPAPAPGVPEEHKPPSASVEQPALNPEH